MVVLVILLVLAVSVFAGWLVGRVEAARDRRGHSGPDMRKGPPPAPPVALVACLLASSLMPTTLAGCAGDDVSVRIVGYRYGEVRPGAGQLRVVVRNGLDEPVDAAVVLRVYEADGGPHRLDTVWVRRTALPGRVLADTAYVPGGWSIALEDTLWQVAPPGAVW